MKDYEEKILEIANELSAVGMGADGGDMFTFSDYGEVDNV